MNAETGECVGCGQVQREFQHLKADWLWLFLFGILLTLCGTAAIVYPLVASLAAVMVLGGILIVAGIATVVTAFWAGKWGGMLLQLLAGVLYLAVGLIIIDSPLESIAMLTVFLAAFFIVMGGFRILAALAVKFPYWGWALLNGIVTLLLGIMILRLYKNVPEAAIWVLGLLVGLDMLFHGWNWVILSLAVRRIPDKAVAA